MKPSKIRRLKRLPEGLNKNGLLIYDRRLASLPFVNRWIGGFPRRLAVTGGESLKDLTRFPRAMKKILPLASDVSSSRLKIVALGGGSVGDFAGFVASVLKRGVGLVQIPSTWLAAVDSAHGGKTALNLPPYKNQIGSFHAAEAVYLVGDVLNAQPSYLAKQALAELAKIALIDSSSFWRNLGRTGAEPEELLWKHLNRAVAAKWKIVLRDPYERKGARQVLNLGHTFGHFLEGEFGLSHGEAVAQGLFFALEWSRSKKLMSLPVYESIFTRLSGLGFSPMAPRKVSVHRFRRAILQDKKSAGDGFIRFVFLREPGRTEVRPVSVDEMLAQARKSGWIG